MFDKEAQRQRAAEFAAAQLAKGAKPVPPQHVPLSKSAGAWPFATPAPASAPMKSIAPKVMSVKPVHKGFAAREFVNNLGQTVRPNDKVVVVAQGYSHQIKTLHGVFLGVNLRPDGKISSVAVQITGRRYIRGQGYIDQTWRQSYTAKRVYALK